MTIEDKLDDKTKFYLLAMLQIDRIAREQDYPEMMLDDKTKADYENKLIKDYKAERDANEKTL